MRHLPSILIAMLIVSACVYTAAGLLAGLPSLVSGILSWGSEGTGWRKAYFVAAGATGAILLGEGGVLLMRSGPRFITELRSSRSGPWLSLENVIKLPIGVAVIGPFVVTTFVAACAFWPLSLALWLADRRRGWRRRLLDDPAGD